MQKESVGTRVALIGGGPIGLAGGLLLAQQGIACTVIDRRGRTSIHPKSRLVDAVTMELMRQLGVESQVEATGLGPDWTQFNRWFDCLAENEVARIYTPSFHTVPSDISPSKPVMTTQDSVEAILFDLAAANPLVDMRFHTEVDQMRQDPDGVNLELRDLRGGERTSIRADYAIGSDGVNSATRAVINAPLEADFMDVFFQDVIFKADFSSFMDGRKGGLLFITHEMGASVFQPLDGVTRWRVQIGGLGRRDEKITPEFAAAWIRSAVSRDHQLAGPIEVKSITEWQFMPGRTSTFGRGRIFLAGDAAHVFIPTGGLGNNTGFVGIRNLTWKLAFVLKGAAPPSLLDTYDMEHQVVARDRVNNGTHTSQLAAEIFRAHHRGGDTAAAATACAQYGNYNGLIFGYELSTPLCAADPAPPPEVADPIRDFVPIVRSGRRAPHVWLDSGREQSVLDWFGLTYVLLTGQGVGAERWRGAVERLQESGFPMAFRQLPSSGLAPWPDDEVVLVRPDGIVADHWRDDAVSECGEAERIERQLPASVLPASGVG